MKIGLIRHFPVSHPFLKGWVTQAQVLQWFEEYDRAAVEKSPVVLDGDWEVCYSSELPRAKETASFIFKGDMTVSGLLNEPYTDPLHLPRIKLPFKVWGLLFRFALIFNHSSQSQRAEILEKRLKAFLAEVMNKHNANVLIVSHAFSMEVLSRLLLKQGFTGKKLTMPKHGVLFLYEKKQLRPR